MLLGLHVGFAYTIVEGFCQIRDGKEKGWVGTSIQSIAIFSSSTTMASIFRPSTTDTAVSYFRAEG